ncbi:MAG: hypothetical protein PVG25_06640 [Anaerolineae bacterium]
MPGGRGAVIREQSALTGTAAIRWGSQCRCVPCGFMLFSEQRRAAFTTAGRMLPGGTVRQMLVKRRRLE